MSTMRGWKYADKEHKYLSLRGIVKIFISPYVGGRLIFPIVN